MPLRNLIRASPETFSDLLLAADDRYREGEELLVRQEFDGCVYLFGYASEMWLKAACLRLQRVLPTAQVKSALPGLRSWMRIQAPHVAFSDCHDLPFFAEFVMEFRRFQGRPLPLPVALLNTWWVKNNWLSLT